MRLIRLMTFRRAALTFWALFFIVVCSMIRLPSGQPPANASQFGDSLSPGFFSPPPGVRPVNRLSPNNIQNARPSYAWLYHGNSRELVQFSTPIQHVVVIYMENRTPENLFGGIYSWVNPATGNTFGQDLKLVDPASLTPTLPPLALTSQDNPGHQHWDFHVEAVNHDFSGGGYFFVYAPPTTSASPAVENYIKLIENWAYNNSTLQSNEGPSFPAHQYAIAGQSGGLSNSNIAPNGIADNPNPKHTNGDPGEGTCAAPSAGATGGNMHSPYPTPHPTPSPSPISACNEYPTIFDALETAQPHPIPSSSAYLLWQYVAMDETSIWSAPMSVTHLYNAYNSNPTAPWQPFAIDPDAENFVLNVSHSVHPTANPSRPFAELTYLTPCLGESDHPNNTGPSGSSYDDGPDWLAYILNAIGTSGYWNNTAVIVTWDDWGGWYDNFTAPPAGAPWPYHPSANPYGNTSDPNEWGYRVPLMMISPYVKSRGYISSTFISQGAILNFIETTLGMTSNALNGDDLANGSNDLTDMLCLTNSCTPFSWNTLPTSFVPANNNRCPSAPGNDPRAMQANPPQQRADAHGNQTSKRQHSRRS